MSNTSDELAKVMARLQKILAIANDERANANEAAAAAEQAEKIMRKFQLSHADVLASEMTKKKEGQFTSRACKAVMKRDLTGKSAHNAKKVPPWAGWLAFAVAKLNDCEIRYGWTPDQGAVVKFYGYDADVQVCAWMFDYLVGALIASARGWQKIATRSKAESESYRRGFILILCNRLREDTAQKAIEMQAEVAGRSLMIVKAKAIAEEFGEFAYGKASSITVSRSDAYVQGREAGKKVDLNNRGVSHTAAPAQKAIA